ncbi:MAG: hypothetical protein NUV64_01545 [Parcubacteria group bacterium]|nr:hypothetical protein [Parcubacteria group bacterium]MCR4342727.1 hypothetical protein [Patescibacteria group bacterium]
MPKHRPIKFENTLEPTLRKEVEKIIKENPKARTILHATLAIIAVGGVLTIGAVAPGLAGGLNRMQTSRKKKSYEDYQKIWNSFNTLKKRRELQFIKEKDGYLVYSLSKKGKDKIKKFIFDEFQIKKPQVWDKKWRLVIFDVPESRRKDRVALRKKLVDLGFYQCQKSAWVHPFPCLEEIEFLKNILRIKPFVKLFLVEDMTDGKAMYHFKDLIKSVVIRS